VAMVEKILAGGTGAARAQLYRLKAGAFARVVSVMTHVAADG
jgi:hypothetical protein